MFAALVSLALTSIRSLFVSFWVNGAVIKKQTDIRPCASTTSSHITPNVTQFEPRLCVCSHCSVV